MSGITTRQYVLVCVLVLLALAPSFAFAAGLETIVPERCTGSGGCQSICDVAVVLQNILNDAIILAVFLAAILFAYAGFLMLFGGTNPVRLSAGKKLFGSVLVGLIIILAAWLIINALMSLLVTGNANSLPWNSICPGGNYQNTGGAVV